MTAASTTTETGFFPQDAARLLAEARVAREAHEFDLVPLLDLLLHMGYRPEEFVFQSHFTHVSQPGLVHSVEFRGEPIRQVVITVNLGLLDPKGPLPSYFTKLLEHGNIDEQAFLRFLHFFDHFVIRNFLKSVYPESDPAIHKDWEGTKRHYLSLLGLRSTSTLHAIFQGIFPELGVFVGRGSIGRDLTVECLRLGSGVLGRTSLGARSTVPVTAAEVTLYCEEEYTEQGRPWADEIQRRLASTIFPILRDAGLDLMLTLVIWSQRGWAQLKPGSYLGFDRIRGGEARRRVVVIHRGQIPRKEAENLSGDRS
jgi:hypothetical protein